MEIDLKDFVSKTLSDIDVGISSSKNSSGKKFELDISSGGIEFDVAVVATQADKKGGGAGFNVSVVGIGGKLGGRLQSTNSFEKTHRIKFKVTSVYPDSPSQAGAVPPEWDF